MKRIGKHVLYDESDIVMVIRGHEDLDYNIKVMKDDSQNWQSISNLEHNLKCNIKNNKFDNMTHNITINKNDKKHHLIINDKQTDFLPIITVSTNTDLGKNLIKDSYVILSFDESLGEPNCVQYGGNIYKHKYYKYLTKINNYLKTLK